MNNSLRHSITKKNPRILLTNDDGIYAPGIRALEEIIRKITDDIWVVAPEREQSGAGHSLTLRRPLRLRNVEGNHYAVDGTPTDCVLLATMHLLKDNPPDLVISGINNGINLGEDVMYSGTLAAAIEACMLGFPAIALSQEITPDQPTRWTTAQHHALPIIRHLMEFGWEKNVIYNVNFPDLPAEKVKGTKVTHQGQRMPGDMIVKSIDPRGKPYYWIGPWKKEESLAKGSDLAAIDEGYISVTPLHPDMTYQKALPDLEGSFK